MSYYALVFLKGPKMGISFKCWSQIMNKMDFGDWKEPKDILWLQFWTWNGQKGLGSVVIVI